MTVLADSSAANSSLKHSSGPIETLPLFELGPECAAEVMQFLSRRPKHTFGMQGLIRDNGLQNPLNRGTFYGCRNQLNELVGVALIGHHTLFEVTSDSAMERFAEMARQRAVSHMVLGEEERVGQFWRHYRQDNQREARLAWREMLMEMAAPLPGIPPVSELRTATLSDLDLIIPVHAEMALEESGVDPLEIDRDGFTARCARRVEQGRVWVWIDEGSLIFKAEVLSDTPDLVYIEGVWVNSKYRGRGYLARCLSQMAAQLLGNGRSMCILVNENKANAIRAYEKAGFTLLSYYAAIFV